MAVGHHLPVVFVDPCRAQGQQYPVGTRQGFGACLAGGVHRSQRLVRRRGRERAVEPVVEPQFAVEVQLGMLYGRLVRIASSAAAMESGLNRMPVGFVTMRNRASASRPAMCSAKQEPRARMRFP